MIVAGIDYSMTSPAICVYDTKKKLSFENTKVFVYTSNKKLAGVVDNMYLMKQIPYESEEERFDNISEWAMAIIKKMGVKEVCIEGYSMGSRGKVFNIGENGGVLKHKLYKNQVKISCIPTPTQAKKAFAGKGNAKKKDMYDSFIESENYDIIQKLGIVVKDPYDSPVSDIVDSYAMLCYLVNSMRY